MMIFEDVEPNIEKLLIRSKNGSNRNLLTLGVLELFTTSLSIRRGIYLPTIVNLALIVFLIMVVIHVDLRRVRLNLLSVASLSNGRKVRRVLMK